MNDLFRYDSAWDEKNLSKELVSTNYKYELLADEPLSDVFTFPLFTHDFCDLLSSKLSGFDEWTVSRHAKYPTNDVLIENFDRSFAEIYDSIIRNILHPALNCLYETQIDKNFDHETFIVRYDPDHQGHLDLHHDSASFTFITTLTDTTSYEGGGTWFPKHKTLLKADKGVVTMHPSLFTHRHGVRPLTSGKRFAIVSFCKIRFG